MKKETNLQTLIHKLSRALVAVMAVGIASIAAAQTYPSKLITIKVAYPPGAGVDATVRPAGPVLQRTLGQSIVVENMPGANGSIAAMNVLHAEPDGYTLLATAGPDLAVAPLTIMSAKYTLGSFKLIGVFGISDMILVTSASSPFKSLDAVVEQMQKPGSKELTIAHWGLGTLAHLAAADFQQRVGAKLLDVPYKGIAPVATAVAGAEIDLAFVPLAGPIPGMIKTGRIKAVAFAGAKRSPLFPEVATLSEHPRFKGFEFGIWSGLFVPARVPDAVVARLNTALNEWAKSPENVALSEAQGLRILEKMTPQQAQSFFRTESDKYTGIAKTLNLVPQ